MRVCLLGALLWGCRDRGEPDDSRPHESPPESTPPDDSSDDSGGDSAAPAGLEVTVVSPSAGSAWDECAELCFSALLTRDGQPLEDVSAVVETDLDGILGTAETDARGAVEVCASGLSPGSQRAAFSFRVDDDVVRALVGFDVLPFGYDVGLIRPVEPLDAVPWTPDLTRYEGNPVVAPASADAWDGEGVLLPSVAWDGARYTMVYAGTPEEDYEVGGAFSDDGLSWTLLGDAPILPMAGAGSGSWRALATNSPVVIWDEDLWKVWYTGRAEDETLAIGLATSGDGETFVDASGEPVFSPEDGSWEGGGVAHPSILKRDGVYELWYSTNEHLIGYALSTDGESWTRYCHNPILEGDLGTWEHGQVKSAEVAWDGEQYVMTYAGGESGGFQVGWAASRDGIRWVKNPEPLMGPGDAGTWESQSVLGAALLLDGDTVRVWYSGTSPAGSAIGYAEGTR